jgi:DNA-binding NarL/FixJ family response regulator
MGFDMSAQLEYLASAARKFLVIDDHPFFLDGLKLGLSSLESLNCSVDSYTSAHAALIDVSRLRDYDLILCDLNLPGLDGISFIEQLIEHDVFVRVAIISASQYALDVRRALNAGAAGYINKCVDINEFAHAIHRILRGQRYTPEKHSLLNSDSFQPGNSLRFPEQTVVPEANPTDETLALRLRVEQAGISPRQYEVLQLVARGLSNQAISKQLAIQESTVKSHLKALFQILGVNNRTASIVAARALKLLIESD